jgi:hypothetical protein
MERQNRNEEEKEEGMSNVHQLTGESMSPATTTKKTPRPRPSNAEVKAKVKEARKLLRDDPSVTIKTLSEIVQLSPMALSKHLKPKPRGKAAQKSKAQEKGKAGDELLDLVRAVDAAKDAYHDAKTTLLKYLDENKDLL